MSLRIRKDGHEITTVQEWFRFAPPKEGSRQWVDGRSAKELAKSFLERGVPAVPPELCRLLSSHRALGTVDLVVAMPEHKIRLDRFRGETRNADMAAVGHAPAGKISVTIEAKADEPFGMTIGKRRAAITPGSNVTRRITGLADALMGQARPAINGLRYQLLHGAAASLIFAREEGAVAAVFIVHEFRGPTCKPENLDRNRQDFARFVSALAPGAPPPAVGHLAGPFTLPGGGFVPAGMPLYLGKAVRKLT